MVAPPLPHNKLGSVFMFYIVRVISFSLLCILLLIFFGKKFLKLEVRKKVICILNFLIIFSLSISFPIESYFLSFETPEAAFQYQYLDEKIYKTIETEQGAFILYRHGYWPRAYVNKKDNRFYCKTPFTRTVWDSVYISENNNMSYSLETILNEAGEQLIVVSYPLGDYPNPQVTIEDNVQSEFIELPTVKGYRKYMYVVIPAGTDGYELTINGMNVKWDGKEWSSDWEGEVDSEE